MNNETKIIFFTCVGHFFCHFYELIFPALAIPLMISLKMSLPEVLKLSFFMYLLLGLGALPWGIISDHYGNHRSLVIFFIGTGIGAIMTAFSNSGTSIMLSLATIGFFASIYHPAGMGLISLGIKNRGMALGINGVAGNLGLATAPFVAGLLNWLVGWQITYLLIGLLSIFWGIILYFKKIDETPVHRNDDITNTGSNNNYLQYFLILCVVMTLAGLAYRANNVVLPAYLEFKADFLWKLFQNIDFNNIEGTKTMAATLLASSIYMVGIFGQLAGGKLADKYDLRWLYLIFHGLSLPFLIFMGILSEQLLVISAAIYIFFALGMQPIENSLVAKFTPNRWRSTGYGIKFILTFGVGSTAVYFVGWIKEAWSLNVVYFFSGGIVVLILLCIALLILFSRGITCKNIP
ncbi:MAG: MFS transporter [Thermodesulfobacteriota bacterium]|nr:MFS transporter [Thermodesulfobacteriota bacterium]